MTTLQDQLAAFAKAHGGTLRHGPQPRKPASIGQSQPVQTPQPAPGLTLDDYRKALAAHDWLYDYSDDYSVWCRGRDSLARLQAMARTLDPDHVIWREYARS